MIEVHALTKRYGGTVAVVAAGLAVRILVLTTFNLDEYVFAALRAGASGFLLKDVPPADLLTGIRAGAVVLVEAD